MPSTGRRSWKCSLAVLVLLGLAAVIPAGGDFSVDSFSARPPQPPSAVQYQWQDVSGVLVPRTSAAVVVLDDGDIMIIGGTTPDGPTKSTEIFDMKVGAWRPGPVMATKRTGHTATLLNDGRILVAGGDTGSGTTSSAEILTASTATSTVTPSMTFSRSGHSAILLQDGRVLVMGGSDWISGTWKQAEMYDPAQNKWLPAGAMANPRVFFCVEMLRDGRVLAVNGDFNGTSERYDPTTNSWGGVAPMSVKRYYAASAMIDDGKVLAAGGLLSGSPLRSAELYDLASNSWTSAGNMSVARSSFSMTKIASGAIMAAGSYSNQRTTKTTEIFNPSNMTWVSSQPMNHSRGGHGYAVFSNGNVFVISGWSDGKLTTTVEAFAAPPIQKPKYCRPIDLVPLVQAATELPGQSGNGLIAKLRAAQAQYDNASLEVCLNVMNAFYNQIRAFAQSGHLLKEHAVALYDGYASVVTCIGGIPRAPTPEMML
jgi:hypothetical protein